MGRKRKKQEEKVVIFCFYCDRIFADESTLVQHQKAKHFKARRERYFGDKGTMRCLAGHRSVVFKGWQGS